VFVGDPATMRAQVVWRRRVLQRPPLWTSDGRTLVVAAGGDLYRVSTAGGARRITRERPRRGVLGPPTVSPRGRVAFSTVPLEPSQLDLYTVRPDGADIRRLTSTPVDELLPKLSTDRRQIAFVRAGGIYTMPAGGGPARRVAAGESYDWGPDGRMVVARGGRLRIGDRILPTGEGRAELPSWSPDGRMIVFARGVDLYAVAPDGTGLRRVTDEAAKDEKPCGLVHSATAPAFSPDGSRIAFVELEASATACGSHGGFGYPAVMDADGSDARVIDHALLVSPYDSGVATIAWAPDGTQVVFDMEYDIAPSGSGPIAIEPVAGGGARFLLRRAGSAETPFWLPAP
jgi:Tol biopolymer transport system component